MTRHDEQHGRDKTDAAAASAASSSSSMPSAYPSSAGATRPAPWRTHGTPIRVGAHESAATAPAEAQAPEGEARGGSVLARLGRAAFLNRNFALLWWGQAISSVGDYVWDTALVLWIATTIAAGQSWAPLAVSGAILAAALPQIVVGPLAGVFVDRWDKRRTMIVATAAQAVFAALLIVPATGLALPVIGPPHLPTSWLLGATYLDIGLLTICAQFYLPAQFALIKDIVARPKQDQAIEMTQAIQGLAIVLGPPAAAALVFGLGRGWALLLNALSFVACFLAALAVSAPPSARR